ncbi:hypothetical protein C0Q70_13334 [Pomacea canaliculata]|uniref:Peptidase M4 domain-containing protein n=1 Tax=Pomacea canaliculata TaxID=400727 RepID=A0A2T7NWY0_POMCA|nr:hypothetical protein C0Q70_13334 [Pomacea canaliculata]
MFTMKTLLVALLVGLLQAAGVDGATRVDAKRHLLQRLEELGGPPIVPSVRPGVCPSGTSWGLDLRLSSRGRQVFDSQITVESDPVEQEIVDITGSFVKDIEDDTGGQPSVYPNQALYAVLQEMGDNRDKANDIKIEIKIFLDENSQAFPGYFVQYLVEDDIRPRRPTAIVDGRDGRVVMKWNSLSTLCPDAQGVGGNEKVGRRVFDGEQFPCLEVTKDGEECVLENRWVKVVNMDGSKLYNITNAMKYDCHMANDSINGAYSPALDAFFIGTRIVKMFSEWFNITVIKDNKLILRVHYGINYTNAFWNGANCTFGDSMGFLFPFVAPDTVGHEVGHALIEQHSGLLWYQEPGAINEAFADITGEVIEHYISGHDWMVGMDIVRGGTLSGVPRLPARQSDVLASDVHLQERVCELMKSVYDLGQNGGIYKEVFEHVGIQVCETEDHVVGLRNNQTYRNLHVSNTTRPVFTFGLPGEWTAKFWVKASSQKGDVHITVSNQTWLQAYDPDTPGILVEGLGSVSYTVTNRKLYHVTITLSSDSADLWDDVVLEAGYLCLAAQPNKPWLL